MIKHKFNNRKIYVFVTMVMLAAFFGCTTKHIDELQEQFIIPPFGKITLMKTSDTILELLFTEIHLNYQNRF